MLKDSLENEKIFFRQITALTNTSIGNVDRKCLTTATHVNDHYSVLIFYTVIMRLSRPKSGKQLNHLWRKTDEVIDHRTATAGEIFNYE